MTRHVQNAVDASFEFVGKAIALIAFGVAVILAAPFMVIGWLLLRMGWLA